MKQRLLIILVLLLLPLTEAMAASRDTTSSCMVAVTRVKARAQELYESFRAKLEGVPQILQPAALNDPLIFRYFDALTSHLEVARRQCEGVRDGTLPAGLDQTSPFDHKVCKKDFCD